MEVSVHFGNMEN